MINPQWEYEPKFIAKRETEVQHSHFTLSPRVDNSGWGNETIKYVSLYEFLGKNAGKDIGQRVWNASKVMGVESIKKEHKHSGSEIKYRHYPQAWLEMWFRDFDAQLSMEVYNKEIAKEALKRINKNSK